MTHVGVTVSMGEELFVSVCNDDSEIEVPGRSLFVYTALNECGQHFHDPCGHRGLQTGMEPTALISTVQGLCIDGACTCTGGWIGPDCRQRPTTTAMSTTENGYTAKEDTSGKKSSMNDTTTTAMSTTENGYTAKEDTSGKKSSMNDTTTTAMSTTENGYTAKEDTSGKKSSMNDTCGRSLFV
ncbi:hypothetical protein DPMN_163341 [Dreissena polymorpha]|uniref:EGF-like domain-containing protein n=1 Tax=Dreissena polymorpha TaxID=45954 RepID=A0A9D4IR93_DREPO|nr:hypothetical protein DPMN_163341 [Dreissena polymorpha]